MLACEHALASQMIDGAMLGGAMSQAPGLSGSLSAAIARAP